MEVKKTKLSGNQAIELVRKNGEGKRLSCSPSGVLVQTFGVIGATGISDEELRVLMPFLQHKLDHGTLYDEPKPIRHVRAKRKGDGQEMEGRLLDGPTRRTAYMMWWRNSEGNAVCDCFHEHQLTDITTIEG